MNEFDLKASSWDDDPAKVERAKIIASRLKERLNGRHFERAMEYGSGTGLLGFELVDVVNHLTLMDVSLEMTRVANTKISNSLRDRVEAIQIDLIKDKLPEQRYDLIFSLLTFHHIDDTEKILEKLHKLLIPGGILAIIDLEKEDGSFHTGEFHGHLGFEENKLTAQLIKSNFSPEQYSTIYSVTKENGKSYPLFLSLSQKSK